MHNSRADLPRENPLSPECDFGRVKARVVDDLKCATVGIPMARQRRGLRSEIMSRNELERLTHVLLLRLPRSRTDAHSAPDVYNDEQTMDGS